MTDNTKHNSVLQHVTLFISAITLVLVTVLFIDLQIHTASSKDQRNHIEQKIDILTSTKMDDRYRGVDAKRDFNAINDRLDDLVAQLKEVREKPSENK